MFKNELCKVYANSSRFSIARLPFLVLLVISDVERKTTSPNTML